MVSIMIASSANSSAWCVATRHSKCSKLKSARACLRGRLKDSSPAPFPHKHLWPHSRIRQSPAVARRDSPCSLALHLFFLILPFLVDSHLRTPYSQSWSTGIQIEPYPSLLLEADYVRSKGTHLLRLVDGNPPQPNLVAALIALGLPPDSPALQFTSLWLGANEINPATGMPVLPFNAVNNNAFL